MAGAGCGRSGSVSSLPPPRPKSPPHYPDLYGKRRELAKVQMLEREIGFLEEELKSIEGLQPASRPCKEVTDFVSEHSDPLIPTIKKSNRSCCRWKRLCGSSCFNLSWICCWCRCSHIKMPADCCNCSISNCCSSVSCSIPRCQCFSCPTSQCCCSKPVCKWSCCSLKCPSCLSCSCNSPCTCSYPRCPKLNCSSCCRKCCCFCPCYFCY